MLVTLAVTGMAIAESPLPLDTETVRPSFGSRGFSGLDTLTTNRRRTFRWGASLLYEDLAPLPLQSQRAGPFGTVVDDRLALATGVSVDVQRATFSLVASSAGRWGFDLDRLVPAALAFGTVGGTARYVLLGGELWRMGARATTLLPAGRSELLRGTRSPELGLGLLISRERGPLLLASDVGLSRRTAREDAYALDWRTGARLSLPDAAHLAATAQLLARGPLAWTPAETSVDLLAGIEVYPSRSLTVSLEAGHGLPGAEGTADLRALGGFVWQKSRPDPLQDLSTQPDEPYICVLGWELYEPHIEEDAATGERVIESRPLWFAEDNTLSEISQGVVADIAFFIVSEERIGHVVVEWISTGVSREVPLARVELLRGLLIEHGVPEQQVSYAVRIEAPEGSPPDSGYVRLLVSEWRPTPPEDPFELPIDLE